MYSEGISTCRGVRTVSKAPIVEKLNQADAIRKQFYWKSQQVQTKRGYGGINVSCAIQT